MSPSVNHSRANSLNSLAICVAAAALIAGCQNPEVESQNQYKKGVEFLAKKDLDTAITCFTDCLRHKDSFHSAYYFRGLARFYKEDYPGAIDDLQRAKIAEANYAVYPLSAGAAKLGAKDYDGAIAEFTTVVGSGAGGDADLLLYAHHLRGLAHRAKGDEAQAQNDFNLANARGGVARINAVHLPAPAPGGAPVADRAWYSHGLLGQTQFAADNSGWAIFWYLLGAFVLFCVFMGVYVQECYKKNYYKTLNDDQVAGAGGVGFWFGLISFYLCWGYVPWGWWIGMTVGTLVLGIVIAAGAKK